MRKKLLAICLGAMCLFAHASYNPNIDSLSDSQLERQYYQLANEIDYVEDAVVFFIQEFRKNFAGRELTADQLLYLYTVGFLGALNQNYTLLNNTYNADPIIDKMATLAETCANLGSRGLSNVFSDSNLCSYLTFNYYFAEYDRDKLQSLALLGSSILAEQDPSSLKANQQGILSLTSDEDFYNLRKDFNFDIPVEAYFLNNEGTGSIERLLQFTLVQK
ncbi:hypothetical protein CKF54_05120 [Psittacicella hinzii]|uniref:Uncharacterized protein n=1 Tax=Psittacicella hinzii TaxID=2028575 RepID=A0A3A1Y4B5_9GAMM|nr:hypothetical protein [Psittacicella hinzii]RIY32291.1 hypothetical protein CKF54_05120 [Psittacicella hinzii]